MSPIGNTQYSPSSEDGREKRAARPGTHGELRLLANRLSSGYERGLPPENLNLHLDSRASSPFYAAHFFGSSRNRHFDMSPALCRSEAVASGVSSGGREACADGVRADRDLRAAAVTLRPLSAAWASRMLKPIRRTDAGAPRVRPNESIAFLSPAPSWCVRRRCRRRGRP